MMRIISKFRDYYDIGMGAGYSADITYIRNTTYKKSDHYACRSHAFIIGFCGKVYPVVSFGDFFRKDDAVFLYNINQLDEYIDNLEKQVVKGRDLGRNTNIYARQTISEYRHTRTYNPAAYDQPTYEKYVFRYCSTRDDYNYLFNLKCFDWASDLFEQAPIFTTYNDRWYIYYNIDREDKSGSKYITLNPLLRQFQFQKVFDPYSAYQEISMWLGNKAHPEPRIPDVGNDDLIAAKGFNKHSFRKDKKERS